MHNKLPLYIMNCKLYFMFDLCVLYWWNIVWDILKNTTLEILLQNCVAYFWLNLGTVVRVLELAWNEIVQAYFSANALRKVNHKYKNLHEKTYGLLLFTAVY